MGEVIARRYRTDDLAACLAIFDSNVPTYLSPDERAEFRAFLAGLDDVKSSYLVLLQDGRVVACGGLYIDAERRRASLSWGMVDRRHHGRGIGRDLTLARLAAARANPLIDCVTLETSQHTYGFYEKFGFSVQHVTADGFAPGLDRYEMALPLR